MSERYAIGQEQDAIRIDTPSGESVFLETYAEGQSLTWPTNLNPMSFAAIGEKILGLAPDEGDVEIYHRVADESPRPHEAAKTDHALGLVRGSRKALDRMVKETVDFKDVFVIRVLHSEADMTLVWQRSLRDPHTIEAGLLGSVGAARKQLQLLLARTATKSVTNTRREILSELDHLLAG